MHRDKIVIFCRDKEDITAGVKGRKSEKCGGLQTRVLGRLAGGMACVRSRSLGHKWSRPAAATTLVAHRARRRRLIGG